MSKPTNGTFQKYERMNLCDALNSLEFNDGDVLIRQGAAADGMYFVEEGEVRITMTNSDKEEKEVSFIKCYRNLFVFSKFFFIIIHFEFTLTINV